MKTLIIGGLLLLCGVAGTLCIQQIKELAFQEGEKAGYAKAREDCNAAIGVAKKDGIHLGRSQARSELEQQCREEKAALSVAAFTRGKAEGAKAAWQEADSVIAATSHRHQQELKEQESSWSQALVDSVNHVRNRLHVIYKCRRASLRETIVSEVANPAGANRQLEFSIHPLLWMLRQLFFVLAFAFLLSVLGACIVGKVKRRS